MTGRRRRRWWLCRDAENLMCLLLCDGEPSPVVVRAHQRIVALYGVS
jgi:hypothetical protein